VMDTSTFTHFFRAGYGDILRRLAPGGVVVIPDTVHSEVQDGRNLDLDIPAISDLAWVELAVLTAAEEQDQLIFKVLMPSKKSDSARKNMGECAVLACATHREMVAVIDDSDARILANTHGIRYVNSMWIIAHAYRTLDDIDAESAEQIYEALCATDMRLPEAESFVGWAYEVGLLP
jgi:predicted nucleic acid-binding protein